MWGSLDSREESLQCPNFFCSLTLSDYNRNPKSLATCLTVVYSCNLAIKFSDFNDYVSIDCMASWINHREMSYRVIYKNILGETVLTQGLTG